MTLLWCDGFDHYGDDKTKMTDGAWAEVSNIGSISQVNPRTGLRSYSQINQSSNAGSQRRVFGGPKGTVGLGGAWWFSNLPTVNNRAILYQFRDASNVPQLTIYLQSTGIIAAVRGGTGFDVIGDSVTPAVTAEAYQHIECMATINSSTGAAEVRVNGVTVLSLSGETTTHETSPSNETSQGVVGAAGGVGSGNTGMDVFYLDDLFAYDTEGSYNNYFIGDRRVFTLVPNADSVAQDWVRNVGAADFETINELTPDDDTTYIEAVSGISPNAISEFELSVLPLGVSAISAVVLVNRAKKTDAGAANILATAISGSSTTLGANRPITEAYTYYHDVIEVDPDTAAPFTTSAVDTLKLGIERTA